jgi:hypothetical protein
MQRNFLIRPTGVAALTAIALLAVGCGGGSKPGASPAGQTQATGGSASVSTKSLGTCPLTGQPATAGQNPKRVAVAVKIDNIAPALPQAGINNADVVFEELVEGGLTRLMAIFQCTKASTVGPIRSARISDADVLALLHGSVLGYSGANPADLPPIEANSDAVLISQDADPQYFSRNYSRPAPHNVFSSTNRILGAGLKQRKSLKAPKPLFSYGPIDASTHAGHKASMSWPAASAAWTWNGSNYLRTQDGSADKLTDGSRISAANVVIMNVDIQSTGLYDVDGSPSPLDVTVGSNRVWVLRNGKLVKGRWSRPTISSGLTFTDAAGHTINLTPGRTWVELLPTGRKPTVS